MSYTVNLTLKYRAVQRSWLPRRSRGLESVDLAAADAEMARGQMPLPICTFKAPLSGPPRRKSNRIKLNQGQSSQIKPFRYRVSASGAGGRRASEDREPV